MIVYEHVSKTFPGDVIAVQDLSFEVEEGETLVLLGTSGSGKTTTMKMLNRLIEPTAGTIFLNGENILQQDVIQLRRRVGYAIQHIGLFPHMTVAENIAVVQNLLKWDKKKIRRRTDELLNMIGLAPADFRDRYPSQLSGGQKQRIGVARALAGDPPVVLMDEPFGALDPITREQLQNEFLDLRTKIRKTILFVTHDVFEAVKMGDRILLMNEGKQQQLATPQLLVDEPANQFVDQFLGQHRFQLSLLTRTVASIMPATEESDAPAVKPSLQLPARASLIEALDLFKTSSSSRIAVYQQERFRGYLSKKELLQQITQVLGETGDEA